MIRLTDYPFVTFLICLIVLWTAAKLGARRGRLVDEVREDFKIILTASLTLLGLIVGFTFSMAVSRYDQRKLYEAEEANAIGTEYVRSELLPASDSETVRRLLRDYLDQRILFYQTRDGDTLQRVNATTAPLQMRLWKTVKDAPSPEPPILKSLVVSGMNDVLNSRGYTQAAWLNRIPLAAWTLLVFVAVCANVMLGLSIQCGRSGGLLIAILPVLISVALLLIADIDSPNGGMIRVRPANLISLAASLRP